MRNKPVETIGFIPKFLDLSISIGDSDANNTAIVFLNVKLAVDLGLEKATKKEMEERSIPEMELIHYEKYDYVMIVCKNELDYNDLIRKLGIEGAKVAISKRKINARAIWYDKIKDQIQSKEDLQAKDGAKE